MRGKTCKNENQNRTKQKNKMEQPRINMNSQMNASLNYIGSKHKLSNVLLEEMTPYLEKYNVKTVADLFCGSGAMAKRFFVNYNVVCNDILKFASIVTEAQLSYDSEYSKWIEVLNQTNPVEGLIHQHYCPGGSDKRKFFLESNAKKIDGMRQLLELNKEEIPVILYNKLLGTIIHHADKHANVASVYGAFLKDFKETALKEFKLKASFDYFPPDHRYRYMVLNEDILSLNIKQIEQKFGMKIDAVYLDPPYNQRSYAKNYSPLETIAKYDNPEIKGVTGLRSDSGDYSGVFCKKTKIESGMNKMLDILKDIPLIFMSYNNEGLLTESQIKALCEKKGRKVECIKIDYGRFASRKNQKRDVQEYLFVLENLSIHSESKDPLI
jgi:adenine-specific DNA-methyltransferase